MAARGWEHVPLAVCAWRTASDVTGGFSERGIGVQVQAKQVHRTVFSKALRELDWVRSHFLHS